MSTINNIPFDINRVPSEKNQVPKREGPNPVYPSEAIHPTESHNPVGERRRRKDRRNRKLAVSKERRHLIQRRSGKDDLNEQDATEQQPSPGQIIDLEV